MKAAALNPKAQLYASLLARPNGAPNFLPHHNVQCNTIMPSFLPSGEGPVSQGPTSKEKILLRVDPFRSCFNAVQYFNVPIQYTHSLPCETDGGAHTAPSPLHPIP